MKLRTASIGQLAAGYGYDSHRRLQNPAATPETDAATHAKYTKKTGMKWKVFKDGRHLATSSTKAEAERLAEYLDGEIC